MDFLATLKKILLSPKIGESYFQKAEGGIPPIPPLAPPLMIYIQKSDQKGCVDGERIHR
jgi:hypothetical protein